MDVNRVIDIALKQTDVKPGMMVVERRYGALELHHETQAEIYAAGETILSELNVDPQTRLKPRIVSAQTITGVEGYHSQIVNRMRHGNFITENETLYVLEYTLLAMPFWPPTRPKKRQTSTSSNSSHRRLWPHIPWWRRGRNRRSRTSRTLCPLSNRRPRKPA